MDRRPNTALGIAAASFLALGITACGGSAGSENNPDGLPSPSETVIVDPVAPTDSNGDQLNGGNETPAGPEVPGAQALGSSYTYGHDVTVTVTEVGTGTVTDTYSSLPEGSVYPIYEFTITNGQDAPIDPTEATITVNYGDQGLPADSISYMGDGTSYFFEGTVLPGMSNSIRTGYLVPAGEPIVITFAPDWELNPAIFTK